MINYTMKNINVISFFISLIVFIIINFLFFSNGSKSSSAVSELPKEEITLKEKIECDDNLNDQAKKEWTIEIPQIELKAEISEGTNTETLNQYVGHFEETAKIDGNVGLAAHNRGYPVNYFAKVKYFRLYLRLKYLDKWICDNVVDVTRFSFEKFRSEIQ